MEGGWATGMSDDDNVVQLNDWRPKRTVPVLIEEDDCLNKTAHRSHMHHIEDSLGFHYKFCKGKK